MILIKSIPSLIFPALSRTSCHEGAILGMSGMRREKKREKIALKSKIDVLTVCVHTLTLSRKTIEMFPLPLTY